MTARLADVAYNLEQADKLVSEAFARGASWVILPEFFPTAAAYHPAMNGVAMPLESPPLDLLRNQARRHQGHVGGSYITIRGADRYNTFVLVRPDGSYGTHDKDLPTMWEGCYYRGGSDDGVIETADAAVGAVVCWELLRWQTARRLRGRVDLVVGGSGWWSYPQIPLLRTLLKRDEERSERLLPESLERMARVLGVPVVHAAHAGSFRGRTPLTGLPYPAHFLGYTQITNRDGHVLACRRREEGAGVVIAEVTLTPARPSEPIGEGFWTADLPWSLDLSWRIFNAHARRTYARSVRQVAA
jgi:predicted amidohydrolase